jgi:putative Mg2+ transporter-C (MgtC) family protein
MTDALSSTTFFGNAMPLTLTWVDLAVRLGSTVIAGAIIGYNRTEQGKPAGLRTTMLVCLAAAIAMLQMNYLLTLSGRPSDSFVMNDLMRLPLGILTGVGFIGGGAILRRDNLVVGVTTAATMWYVTVVGLCFGGGQMLLGWAATALGFLILYVLKRVEDYMVTEQGARLSVVVNNQGPGEAEIRQRLDAAAIQVRRVGFEASGPSRTYKFNVHDLGRDPKFSVPKVIEELSRQPGVVSLNWQCLE